MAPRTKSTRKPQTFAALLREWEWGKGSIRQEPDGRYRATIEMGRDSTGKRIRTSVSDMDFGKFYSKLSELLSEKANPSSDGQDTLASWYEWWMANLVIPNGRTNKINYYSERFKYYILPRLGHLRLSEIRRHHISDLFAYLRSQGLAYSTRKGIRAVLCKCLNDAVARERIESNPVSNFKLDDPPPAWEEPAHYTAEQMQAFLAAAEGNRFYPYWYLAFQWGLRPTELLGLKWNCLTLDGPEPTLRVDFDLVRRRSPYLPLTNGSAVLEPTKTGSSKRTIYLSAQDVAVVAQHRSAQMALLGQRFDPAGYVFTTVIGTPLHMPSLRREWHKIGKQAGLPHLKMYNERHSGLRNLLLQTDENYEMVAAVAGHRDTGVLRRSYANVSDELRRKALALRSKPPV